MRSASSCEFIEVEMCRGLSYNLTSFPNIWLSIADQREAATLLRQYRVKAASTTYIRYLDFLVASVRASKIGPLGSKKDTNNA